VAEAQEPIPNLKGGDTKAIGVIGAILVSGVEAIPFTKDLDSVKQATLASVPFFSALFATAIAWFWDCFKPQNAQAFALRRALKKKSKVIKSQLHDPDISEDTKKELQKMLDDITLKHANSFDFPSS